MILLGKTLTVPNPRDETRAQFILDGFKSALAASSAAKHKQRPKDGAQSQDGASVSESQGHAGIAASQYGMAPEDYQTDEYIEQLVSFYQERIE